MIPIKNQQKGFTAVELLITLFVASFFLIAGYQLFGVIINDSGDARAKAKASNVAYDYLRRYANSATSPCVAATPLSNSSITVESLQNVTVTVTITCPQVDAPSLSKVTTSLTYGSPAQTIIYSTFVDKSVAVHHNTYEIISAYSPGGLL